MEYEHSDIMRRVYSVLDYIDSLKFGGLSSTFLLEWMDIHSCAWLKKPDWMV